MLAAADVRTIVRDQIQQLLREADQPTPDITGKELLADLGVSSLMLARLIVQLETEFDVDPFTDDVELTDVRSVDQMVDAYQRALATN